MLKRFDLTTSAGVTDADGPALHSVDELLMEVRDAIASHGSLESVITGICRRFGFEQFVYGAATVPQPQRDSRSLVWTTMPPEWVREYDREAYIEVDPRITETLTRRAPLVWDAADYAGRGPRTDAFLSAAARHGIRSGVVIPLSDPVYIRLGVGFNSPISPVDAERRRGIAEALGDMMLFAAGFHDLFVSSYVDPPRPPEAALLAITPRESQCLELAARGMTSSEIGFKLDISERTVNYHFANIIGKLGVLNRKEAIALAVSKGLVRYSL